MSISSNNALKVNQEYASSNDNIASNENKLANSLWGRQHSQEANEAARQINSTFSWDARFYAVAIEAMKSQMRMCAKRNVVSDADAKAVIEALEKVSKEFAEGKVKEDQTDVYEAIQRRVCEIAGPAGNSLSLGHSRGDQQAGDLRAWTRNACDAIDASLQNLQAALIDKAEDNVKTTFPATAHGQLTQPTSFAHHLMAYVEMFARDRERFKDARSRMNESPYCSGEIAGNLYNYNREVVARNLGFDGVTKNSVDAIADRDYVVEFLSSVSNAMTHLSRLAEEMISWHGSQNKYIEFSNAFVNQSEVLPYRRDPEALEMVRGKAGKSFGALMNVLSTLKGLSLEVSQDLTEVRGPVFESHDTLLNCVNVMSALCADFTINRKQMKEAASHSYSTAIDLVDWLIANTDRNADEAQAISRKIIEYAINKGKKLSLLELSELQKIESKITDDVYSVLIPSRAIISRRSGNGSNPVQIRKTIRAARRNYL